VSDPRAAGERIEQLIDALGAGGPAARDRAEELVRVVVELYGAGLERLLELVDAGGALTESTVDALADDGLVSGLLVVHGLHPYGVAERVERALESVRPYLRSHGGDVELLGVDDSADGSVVGLRLLGHCDGCAGSTATLRSAVEEAVEAAAPEVVRIDVAEPTAPAHPAPTGPLIPADSLTARLRAPA
jgi:Fe-S cluster biogenesis protein NfuA